MSASVVIPIALAALYLAGLALTKAGPFDEAFTRLVDEAAPFVLGTFVNALAVIAMFVTLSLIRRI